jgi:DNA-directed RNA polymerase specialized sigma24 family protein
LRWQWAGGVVSIIGEELARELHFSALMIALEKLTPKQRFVIERSWGLGGREVSPFTEIADSMGISLASTHRMYERAMATIRREMV